MTIGRVPPASARIPSRRHPARLAWPLALLAALAGCKDPKKAGAPPPPPPPAAVDVMTLHAGPVALTTDLVGRVAAFRTAEIRPQVSGVLLRRLFTEGDVVHVGQQLYQIDPAAYQARLASARAQLLHAEAAVRSQQLTVGRFRPLAEARAVSRQDLDNAVGSLQQSQADVASAQAAIQAATIDLGYTRVLSPITGRTSRSSVTEGALVIADQPASLVTVTELDPIYVDVTQPSETTLRLKREIVSGQLRSLPGQRIPVSLVLEDGVAYDQPGLLQFSEVTVDQGTGSVTLRAIFPNPDGLLMPGMFVHELLQEGIQQHAILVPQRAVSRNDRAEPVAMVVDAAGVVHAHILTTPRAIGHDWLASQGLADGDRVIVSGLQLVRPGDHVRATEVPPDPAVASAPDPTAMPGADATATPGADPTSTRDAPGPGR